MDTIIVKHTELDDAQGNKLISRFAQGLAGIPVIGRRSGVPSTTTNASFTSPQQFTAHPTIRDTADASAVGVDAAWPSLPGKVPGLQNDGEMGAAATLGGAY